MRKMYENNAEAQEVIDWVEHGEGVLFMTGRAGTGKSTLLKQVLRNIEKNFVVLAPTGIAALNVHGSTIHSFFGLPLRIMLPGDSHIHKFRPNSEKLEIVRHAEVIIIDEISMVRADLMDAIDVSLRRNTGVNKPFGGKRIWMIGDLFQLPPVLRQDDDSYQLFQQYYDGPFFFHAEVFRANRPKMIELRHVYRQKNADFVAFLDRVRHADLDYDVLQALNSRVGQHVGEFEEFVITLNATNAAADRLNQARLKAIDNKAFTYKGQLEGDFNRSKIPVDMQLTLKKGAQVIFIRNDIAGRWVNGSLGVVTYLDRDSITVQLRDGETYEIEQAEWEDKVYTFDKATGKVEQDVKGTYTQYPLKLAWAVTIHKSQGLTFDDVIIDLGRGAFSGGQTYVALSRCTSLEGISLKKAIQMRDVFVDRQVLQYFEQSQFLNHG